MVQRCLGTGAVFRETSTGAGCRSPLSAGKGGGGQGAWALPGGAAHPELRPRRCTCCPESRPKARSEQRTDFCPLLFLVSAQGARERERLGVRSLVPASWGAGRGGGWRTGQVGGDGTSWWTAKLPPGPGRPLLRGAHPGTVRGIQWAPVSSFNLLPSMSNKTSIPLATWI